LPKRCFVGKTIIVRYHMFYKLWFVVRVKQWNQVSSIKKCVKNDSYETITQQLMASKITHS